MSFNYLNAEQAIRVATVFREAATKEAPNSYNICTLFVLPPELDAIAELLGVQKQVFEAEGKKPLVLVHWDGDSTAARITFQAAHSQ